MAIKGQVEHCIILCHDAHIAGFASSLAAVGRGGEGEGRAVGGCKIKLGLYLPESKEVFGI